MKVTNYHIYGSAAKVQRLKEEYITMGGHCSVVEPGHLVVFAYPPKKENKQRDNRGKGRGPKRQDR